MGTFIIILHSYSLGCCLHNQTEASTGILSQRSMFYSIKLFEFLSKCPLVEIQPAAVIQLSPRTEHWLKIVRQSAAHVLIKCSTCCDTVIGQYREVWMNGDGEALRRRYLYYPFYLIKCSAIKTWPGEPLLKCRFDITTEWIIFSEHILQYT